MNGRSSQRAPRLFCETCKPHGQTITNVRPVERDPNFCEIFTGSRRVAIVSRATSEELRLEAGMKWTQTLADRVFELQECERCRRAALSLLGKKAYSHHDLVQRLTSRGFTRNVVERIATDLQRQGWVDDEAFACDLTRAELRKGPAGARLLASKMRRHGVHQATVDRTIDQFRGHSDHDAAWQLARQKLIAISTLNKRTIIRRIAALLSRRGFEDEIIESTIGRLEPLLQAEANAHEEH